MFIFNYKIRKWDWGLGIGDWDGDWGLGIGPNPQSPIPNPQSPIPNPQSPSLFLNNMNIEYNIRIIDML